MIYYYSGWPYSDELYHHGTKGQQWGKRLYQYEDGSLTPLGRIHYGIGQGAKAVGRGAKKVGSAIVKSYKRKHPRFMSDDELTAEIDRQKKLNELKAKREEYKKGSVGKKVSEILFDAASKGASKLTENMATEVGKKMAERLFQTSAEKRVKSINSKMELMDKERALRKKEDQFKREAEKEAQAKKREKAEKIVIANRKRNVAKLQRDMKRDIRIEKMKERFRNLAIRDLTPYQSAVNIKD